MSLAQVQSLAINFQSIGSISNLQGLTNLTKLALDNNGISKIENIGHLVSIQDLPFLSQWTIPGLMHVVQHVLSKLASAWTELAIC